MREDIRALLPIWDDWMLKAFVVFVLLGIVIYLYKVVRLALIKDYKNKYDFAFEHELNLIRYSVLSGVMGVAFISNTVATEFVYANPTMFFFRLFITIAVGLIIGFTASKFVEFNYPAKLDKKLRKFRYTPRVSPKTGKKMKLLSEEEEDVHLSEGQIAEEDVLSVDYDVWIDEESGFTKIEKYVGKSLHEVCPSCHYHTLKVVKEEIVESPTETQEGELLKHFQCDLCGYKSKKSVTVAKLEESYGPPDKQKAPTSE